MAARKHVTLVGGIAQDVTVTGQGPIRVVNHGTTDVYFRLDGTTAVSAADDTFFCAPGGFRIARTGDHDGTVVASVISSGTPVVTVEVIDEGEAD